MKKIFLLLAFAGIVGASSANTFVTVSKVTTATFKQDDKKKKACCKKDAKHDCSKHEKGKCSADSTKHDCSKHEKAKCHKDSTKTTCMKHTGKKSCCKPGATPAVPPAK